MLFRQMLQRFWKKDPRVLFDDTFDGSAINTNFWTLTDTESKITVSGGNLVFALPDVPGTDIAMATSVKSFVRQNGLTLVMAFNGTSAGTTIAELGYYSNTPATSGNRLVSVLPRGNTTLLINVGGGGLTPLVIAESTDYLFKFVLKTAGHLVYVSSNNGATWSILWETSTGTTSPVYIGYENTSRAFTSAKCSVYLSSPRPPLLSTTPAAPTLTLGEELAAGNLTVGGWYQITATQVDYFYTSCAINDFFRATAATALDANNKVKNIPFDQTGVLEYIGDAGQHDGIYDAAPTVALVNHAGIVAHASSTTAPSYYLHAYVDRTAAKAYLLKVENNTTTELIGVAITYSAGAQLRVVSVGTKHALYYNGAIVGTVQTVDVSSNYGTHTHSFQTLVTDSTGACVVNGGGV